MGQVLEVVGVESMEEKAVIPNTELGFLQRYWGAFSSSLDFFSSKGFLSMGRGVSGSLNEAFAFSFCSSHRRVRVHC